MHGESGGRRDHGGGEIGQSRWRCDTRCDSDEYAQDSQDERKEAEAGEMIGPNRTPLKGGLGRVGRLGCIVLKARRCNSRLRRDGRLNRGLVNQWRRRSGDASRESGA